MHVREYNKGLILDDSPDYAPNTKEFKRALRKSKALFGRYTTNFDCGFETDWYYVIREEAINLSAMKAKLRYKYIKGLAVTNVKKLNDCLSQQAVLEDLYKVYLVASERYKHFVPVKKADFMHAFQDAEIGDVFGVYFKETNTLVGYAIMKKTGDSIGINVLKLDQNYFKYYISFALLYTVVNNYLDTSQNGIKFIHNGSRSIHHETNMQDFLVDRLGFRRAYCQLHTVYKPLMRIAVSVLYPFRFLLAKLRGGVAF